MPPLPKPASHIDWTDGDSSKVQEPGAPKKLLGWVALERPPFEFINWLFFRLDEWVKYLESITDENAANLLNYDAVVHSTEPGATHTTLQAAINAVSDGMRILVLGGHAETVNTKIDISKNRIEIDCKPNVTFTKGTATICFDVTGSHLVFKHGRSVGFTAGGDKCFRFQAFADYGRVLFTNFGVGSTEEIDDSAVTAGKQVTALGTITEV